MDNIALSVKSVEVIHKNAQEKSTHQRHLWEQPRV